MKFQNEYDWAVIGEHPAAVLSGCIAARLGYSVLMLPYSPGLASRTIDQSQVFEPESSFFTGWIQHPQKVAFFQSLLAWLAGDIEHPLLQETVTTRTQLLTRTLRADLQDSLDQLSQSLLDNSGNANISAFFRQRLLSLSSILTLNASVSPDLFVSEDWNEKVSSLLEGHRASKRRYLKTFNRREVINVLRQKTLSQNELLVDLIQSVEKDSEGRSDDDALQTLFRAFFLEHQGVAIPGGIRTLHNLLAEIAKQWGVQRAHVYQMERMFIDKDRFVGFQMKDESERGKLVSVKGGILGCSLDHAKPLITGDGKTTRTLLKKSPEPLGWRFTISIRVDRKGIPFGLGRRSIWVEPGAPHLEIEVVDPSVYSLKGSSDACIVFLRTVLPFKQFSLDPVYRRKTAARMFEVAREQIPFFDRHVLDTYPNENTPDTQDPYAFEKIEAIPENLRVIDQNGVGSQSGVQGLFVATGESYPELGSFGAYLSGIQAVSRFYKALLPKPAI